MSQDAITMTALYDIETIAHPVNAPAFVQTKVYVPKSGTSTKPPKEITKIKTDALREERLAEWIKDQADERIKSVDEQKAADRDKAALCWWTAQVVCITARHQDEAETQAFYGACEETVLRCFFKWLLKFGTQRVNLIGKSSDFFDNPMLVGRCVALDIGVPEFLKSAYRGINDIDQIFGYSSQCSQRGKLDYYAFGMGITGKTGHGTDVATWYSEALLGDHEAWGKIARYCMNDTDIVVEMWRRYRKPFDASL